MSTHQTWVILCSAVIISTIATILWVMATCTEWWEQCSYSVAKLENIYKNTSTETYAINRFNSGYIEILEMKTADGTNSSTYIFEHHSGIWQMCSYLTGKVINWCVFLVFISIK